MALGGTRTSVAKMVLGEVLWLAGISIAVASADTVLDDFADHGCRNRVRHVADSTGSPRRTDAGAALRVRRTYEWIATEFPLRVEAVAQKPGIYMGRCCDAGPEAFSQPPWPI